MSQVPISSIVNVQITRETQGVTKAGFGIPLILTDESPSSSWGSERVREYLTTAEVLEDFSSSSDVYAAAAAILSQLPKVETVKIGKEGSRVAQVQTITFSADLITSNVINGSVDGTALSATTFATDHATTMAAIATKIAATAGVSTATVGGSGNRVITVTAQSAGVPFTLSGFAVTLGASQATVAIVETVANHGPADDLAEISEEDDEYYGVIWNERQQDLVEEMAAYIETVRKIFGTCTEDDTNVLNDSITTDIGSVLSLANYERTFVIYNDDASDFADAALIGKCFPFDPGTETWKFKTLAGITVDNLTAAQRAAAAGKNVNLFVEIGGVAITQEGVMASGEYIDVIRFVDWLQARMEEAVYGRLVNLTKVPFTDTGIGIITNEIRGVLENGIRVGGIANDAMDAVTPTPYTISAPRAVDVSTNDRADRLLPDVRFRARLAGAIHKVNIDGVVTV